MTASTTRSQFTPRAVRIELPTLLIAAIIHLGWLTVTWWHAALPLPLLVLLGGTLVAWHGSLQHETIHGHPTGRRAIDRLIGAAPLSLWLPYAIYRRTHIAHHATRWTTDPHADPESNYRAEAGDWRHRIALLEAPLAARLILGPPIRICLFLIDELRRASIEPRLVLRDWLPHLIGVGAVLWWLGHVGLPFSTYWIAFVYPGTALSLLRSFAEHRADGDPSRRAAIVRRPGPFGLLFLHNNLHAVHHARPELLWYRLPGYFRANRATFAQAPAYDSYLEVVRAYAFRPQDDVIHPDYRRPA
jgi:fatty acid desaturase